MTVRDLLRDGDLGYLDSAIDSSTALLGLAPLAGLALYHHATNPGSFRNMLRSPVAITNRSTQFGAAIGAEARAQEHLMKARRAESAKKVRERVEKSLLKSEFYQNLQGNQQRRAELIQTFSILVDDPNLGLPPDKVLELKHALVQAGNDSDVNLESLITEIVEPLSNSNNETALNRLNKLNNDYKGVGDLLPASANTLPKTGVAYTSYPAYGDLTLGQQAAFDELQGVLGNRYSVVSRRYTDMGRDHTIAQIYSKGGSGARWQFNMPLDKTRTYRTGEHLQTPYTLPRHVIDATRASNFVTGAANIRELNPMSFREFALGEIRQEMSSSGRVDWRGFRSRMATVTDSVSRRAGLGNDQFSRHLRMQAAVRGDRAYIHNLEMLSPTQQIEFQQSMAHIPGLDVGAVGRNILTRSTDGMSGSVGFESSSVYGEYQKRMGGQISVVGPDGKFQTQDLLNRENLPITAREHQIGGRDKMFTEKIRHRGVGRNIAVGGLKDVHFAMPGQPKVSTAFDPFGRTASGGLMRPTIVDFTGGVGNVAGEGYGFTGRAFEYTEAITPTVLDPTKSKLPMQSEALSRIIAGGEAGAEFTGAPVFLGESSTGQVHTPMTPRTTSVNLRAVSAPEIAISGGTKSPILLAGERRKRSELMKLFGDTFKGNIEQVSTEQLESLLGSKNKALRDQMLGAMGVTIDEALIVASDMQKKGAGFYISTLHGAAIGATKNLSQEQIRSRMVDIAQQYANGNTSVNPLAGAMREEYRVVGHLAKAVTELMSERGASPEYIGNALIGIYEGSRSAKNNLVSGDGNSLRNALDYLADTLYQGDSGAAAAMKQGMQRGQMITFGAFTGGEGMEDWNKATASLEPRSGIALFERFESMGLSTEQSARMVSRMYKGKKGFSESVRMVNELMGFQASISGGYTASSFARDTQAGIKRYSWTDFIEAQAQNNTSLTEALKKSGTEGFVLDLATAPRVVRNAAQSVFSGTEIRLPGSALFDSAKGTQIKMTGGAVKEIESELGALFDEFGAILGEGQGDTKQLTAALTGFRKKANQVFASAAVGTLSGKIRGSSSPIQKHISLMEGGLWDNATDMAKLERARKLVSKSRGRLAFLDSGTMLAQMLDSQSDLNLNRRSKLLRMFFTTMEQTDINKMQGMTMALGRHPQMSMGNMFFSDVYRDPREVTSLGGRDLLFEQFKKTSTGQRILRNHFKPGQIGGVHSFSDVNRLLSGATVPGPKGGTRNALYAFFDDFAEHLSEFYKFDTAGAVTVPTVESGGMDLGQGAGAYLDADSDRVITFHFADEEAKVIMNAMKGNQDLAANDMVFRKFVNILGAQTGEAMQNIAAGLGDRGASRLTEDVAKEIGLSIKTGPLDVSLRGLHTALFNHGPDLQRSILHRGLLGSVQELWNIKSKHLPFATGHIDYLRKAAHTLMQTGDMSDFRTGLTSMFQGTDLAGAGVSLDLNEIRGWGPEFADMADRAGTQNYSLNTFFDDLQIAVDTAKRTGTNTTTTASGLARQFMDNPQQAMQMMQQGTDATSAVLKAFNQEANIAAQASFASSQVRASLSGMDKAFTGKLALGLAAGAFILGMSGQDYSAEPMLAPGEMRASSGVMNDISSGNLFNNNDSMLAPAPNDAYANNNMSYAASNITYLDKPNSYQVRGSVPVGADIGSMMTQLRSLGASNISGSLVINDRRQAITASYIDRMLGEY